MRTRRDQVQAYRFVTRRIVSAMLSGEPEAVERPMRRLGLSVFASAMVAALLVAAAGIWGLVTNQGREFGDDDLLVIEADTFTRYVYIDGLLHPVTNLASIRLILNDPAPDPRRNVSPRTLRDVPRGPTLGIPDAPDVLPRADDLVGLPWRLCSVPPTAESPRPQTTLVMGDEVADGDSLGDEALYVADSGTRYLLLDNRLLRIMHDVAPVALGLSAASPAEIGTPLVNAIMTGPDLDVVRPPGFGEDTAFEINDRIAQVGFIYFTAGQHYVMTHDGLRPVGEMTVALRTSIGAAQVRDITGGEVSRYLYTNEPLEPEGFPLEVPEVHTAAGQSPTICAVYRGGDSGHAMTEVEVYPSPPGGLTPSMQLRQTDRDVVAAADRLRLRAGQGALVRAAGPTGEAASEATVYLITDEGMKFPISTPAAQAALGYGGVDPVPVPADLLDLIPTGSTLDIDAARQVAGSVPAEAAG
jgi:type VII secretion protein EccB